MKRYFAVFLAAAAIMSFTACGRTIQRVSVENGASEKTADSVSETKKNDTPPLKRNETKSETATDNAEETTSDLPEVIEFISDEEVEIPINQLFQAIDSGDPDTVAYRIFPDSLVNAMNEADALDFMLRSAGVTIDGTAASFSEIGLVSEKSAENSEAELMGKVFSRYMSAFNLMREKGLTYDMLNNPAGNEELSSINDQLGSLLDMNVIAAADVNITVPIAEVRYVTVSMDGRLAEFPVYRPEGEGWKIDLICVSMMRYLDRVNN